MMLLMHGVGETELRRHISGFFNARFAAGENREPAYRYIYVCRLAQGRARPGRPARREP
jgi:hypothetical protein